MVESAASSGELTRERILDAAEELFARHGFDATPTAKVAADAGVPKGLLFYHFARKIDLLTALFAERMPTVFALRPEEVAVPGDVAGSLVALARRLAVSRQRSGVVRTILWREADTHPEVARCLHTFHEELVELACRVIELSLPGVDRVARHAAAVAWTGTVTMAQNATRLGGDEHDLPMVAGLLARGLRGATP